MSEPDPLGAAYVNFRDLGGHPTPTGVVRRGHLFRSDSLAQCTPDDVEHLVRSHRVATIVDLRRELEVEMAPMDTLRGAGVRVEHLSLIDPAVPAISTQDIDGTLTDRYVSILSTSGTQFVSVMQLIADERNHPLVFQCAAGKDRTGLVAALVLELLGVDDEVIVADYAKTAEVADLILARLTATMPNVGTLGPRIMSAEASTMRGALDWLRATHGSAEAYLVTNGLTVDEITTMRASLIESA